MVSSNGHNLRLGPWKSLKELWGKKWKPLTLCYYIWHSLLLSQAWIHMSCDSICALVKLSITETVTSIMTTVWIKSDIPISNCVYYIITLLEGFQNLFVDRETGLAQVFPEYCSEGHALSIPCKYTTSMALGHWASTISASQALCGRHWRESKKLYREEKEKSRAHILRE